jgi:UDP-N-acetylmuramoylalanine--D-glutamate ligase
MPPFDQLDAIGESTVVVFEMSSHQLEDTSHAPFIAVLLNLYPEHLDRYPTLHAYYSAKMNILYRQQANDVFIFNEDIPEIAHGIANLASPRKYFSFSSGIRVKNGCFLSGDEIYLSQNGTETIFIGAEDETALKGRHNRMNMMAALLAARVAGVGDPLIRNGLLSFRGLEHRLEYVGQFRGIHFYNDSIATIPEAAIEAVKALPDTDTILLGGFDRGLDYRSLMDFLLESDVRNIIFLGQAGQRMHDLLRLRNTSDKNLYDVQSLEGAFELIPGITRRDKICLLSPAAASYDIFRNFEERGRTFKKLARSL